MKGKIILASTSPRRSALLRQLGLSFEAVSPSCDESKIQSDRPIELCAKKAQLKCETTFEQIRGDNVFVIGSDTIVSDGTTIFEKPRTRE